MTENNISLGCCGLAFCVDGGTVSSKNRPFTVQQASELGDYTKPSTRQVSTSKKLWLLKLL